MNDMNVDRVTELREKWQAELDAHHTTTVPVETLIELADLVLRQADALRQLDHGLSLLEELFAGQTRRDEAERHDDCSADPFAYGRTVMAEPPIARPIDVRRHSRRH